MNQVTKVTNDPLKMIASSSNPLMTIDLSNNPLVKIAYGVEGKKKPPILYDYNTSFCIPHLSTYVTTTEWGATDKDIFRPTKLTTLTREYAKLTTPTRE